VVSQHVVSVEAEASRPWLLRDGRMRTMEVAVVHPWAERIGSVAGY
jgi:hypothetical protein